MIFYFLLIFINIIALLCFGRYLNYNNHKLIFLVLSMGFCAYILCFRNIDVGLDTRSYEIVFNTVKDYSLKEIFFNTSRIHMDIGYMIFMRVSAFFVDDYLFFQVISGLLFIVLFSIFAYKNEKNLYLGILMFLGMGVFDYSFNITRQMISVALVADSYTLIKQSKAKRAFALTILAVSFHLTSIIFLIALIIYRFRNNRVITRLIPFVAIIFALNYRSVLNFVITNVNQYSMYSNLFYKNKIGLGMIVYYVAVGIFAMFIIYLKRNSNSDVLFYAIMTILYVVSAIIGLYFRFFERIGTYFVPFTILLFDNYAQENKRLYERIIFISLVCIFFGFLFLYRVSGIEYSTFY